MRNLTGNRILVTSFDSLGDLVLRQPLLSRLQQLGPVGVAGKPSSLALLEYLAPGAVALPLTDTGGDELTAAVEFHPDVVICPLKNPTAADVSLFARLSSIARIALAAIPDPACPVPADAERRREQMRAFDAQFVEVPEWEAETASYRTLWRVCGGSDEQLPPPRMTLPASVVAAAAETLASLHLSPGRFAVLCPAGSSSVPFKVLDPRSAAAVAAELQQRAGLDVLLAGAAEEAGHLHECASACSSLGLETRSWIGGAGSLATFLGMIAESRILVGIDSGPLHFAAALGVPVVGVYGGGTFGRFLPESDRAVAACRELPCYRCGWECWLGRAICLDLDPGHLTGCVSSLLDGDGGGTRVLCPQPAAEGEAQAAVLRQARQTVREINADRDARLRVILEAQAETADFRRQLEAANADREARLQVILDTQRQLGDVTRRLEEANADREARLQAMLGTQRQLGDMTRYLDEVNADRDARLDSIHLLQRQMEEFRLYLDEVNADREARLQAIRQLQGELAEQRLRLEEVAAARDAALQRVDELEKSIAGLEAERQSLRQSIEAWLARRRLLLGLRGYELTLEVPERGRDKP